MTLPAFEDLKCELYPKNAQQMWDEFLESYPLYDFYIKTAYNAASGGNFKNSFVDSSTTTPPFCALQTCLKQGVKSGKGEPTYGNISERIRLGKDWRDKKGKEAVRYANVMDKLEISREEGEKEASALNSLHFTLRTPESTRPAPLTSPILFPLLRPRGRPFCRTAGPQAGWLGGARVFVSFRFVRFVGTDARTDGRTAGRTDGR